MLALFLSLFYLFSFSAPTVHAPCGHNNNWLYNSLLLEYHQFPYKTVPISDCILKLYFKTV